MYLLLPLMLAFTATTAEPRPWQRDYPSCEQTQRAAGRDPGPSGRQARLDHVAMRADILQADIATARKARRITARQATRLWQQVDATRKNSERIARRHGDFGAAERARYDRQLDASAARLCR